MQSLPDNAAAILFASTPKVKNHDCTYPFSQNSDFFYLTGFNEPNSALLLLPKQKQTILFLQEKNTQQERWHGKRMGYHAAKDELAIDEAYDIESLSTELPHLLSDIQSIYHLQEQAEKVKGAFPNKNYRPIDALLGEMRLIKDQTELDSLQRAIDISVEAHVRAMEIAEPGQYEYELEAALMHEFIRRGARHPGYEPIVASGPNTGYLHYCENNRQMRAGDLVLIDAGCEIHHYTADLTRTFPISRTFSKEQAAIYEAVLQAQLAVIACIKPGVLRTELESIAEETLTLQLKDLGLLTGSINELIEKKTVREFYYHGVSHWLGLDVHDAGSYTIDDQPRPLEPGMVLTVEPGLYLNEHPSLNSKWHHIGVRIEDDILVTDTGYQVLSQQLPKTIKDIEALRHGKI